jgi:hypothetical protein
MDGEMYDSPSSTAAIAFSMSVAMARLSTNPTRKRRYNTIVPGPSAAQLIINRSDYLERPRWRPRHHLT